MYWLDSLDDDTKNSLKIPVENMLFMDYTGNGVIQKNIKIHGGFNWLKLTAIFKNPESGFFDGILVSANSCYTMNNEGLIINVHGLTEVNLIMPIIDNSEMLSYYTTVAIVIAEQFIDYPEILPALLKK